MLVSDSAASSRAVLCEALPEGGGQGVPPADGGTAGP